MAAQLLDKMIAQLIHSGSIREDDKDLYAYGLQQGLFIILNVLTTVAIGLISGMFWQSILFMAAYLPLRSFAGGYHAKTQLLCYLYSIMLTSAVLWAIKLIPWTNSICLGLALLAGAVIFILGPVEDSNKPLDQIEIATYKRRTRAILLFEMSIIVLMLGVGHNDILPGMSVSLFALSVMLVLGKVKKHNKERDFV
ncbi:accessory gene regulator B [Fontibacillus panacisegetis]|uniref:Accessory gene regulator B n=2 Tax=Fontibacillus panacisegetis TaxID=670482 RepID=A0A1G7GUC1_9BACL|nr:accessory gene regulator B [Fontibacillus panacisegetis]